MTIKEAMEKLEAIAIRHGYNIEIYFDCPKCLVAYKPEKLETESIVMAKSAIKK